jgi:hypothetical protein
MGGALIDIFIAVLLLPLFTDGALAILLFSLILGYPKTIVKGENSTYPRRIWDAASVLHGNISFLPRERCVVIMLASCHAHGGFWQGV